jgi:hypothetical protein
MTTTDSLVEHLHAIAAALSARCGESWVAGSDDERFWLAGPEEMRLDVMATDSTIRVSGSYHVGNTWLGNGPAPKITVQMRDGAQSIARSIAQRLLPEYRSAFLHARAAHLQSQAKEREQRRLCRELAALVGETPFKDYPERFSGYLTNHCHVRCQVSTYNPQQADGLSVTLELSYLSPSQAAALLQLLANST